MSLSNTMCCFLRMFLFGVIVAELSLRSCYTEAFNVEVRHYTTYRKELDSMFGFSVAEYRDKSRRGWVIVGAPEAQTSQPNVYRGGAVYRCDIAIDDSCIPVEFDRKDQPIYRNDIGPTLLGLPE
ncbi:hypothetical protein PV325_000551 [Microctonus aethiopoides]|nr:hypothetical protein PV325_000551 [Microctonus aethiopoides]